MLRRTLADVIDMATQDLPRPEASPAAGPADGETPDGAWPGPERRFAKTDRRSVHALRAEVQRTLVPGDRRKQGSPRPAIFRSLALKPSRLLLLVVALIAGGAAAFLATQHDQPIVKAVQEKLVPEARTQILVARQAIGMGEKLSPISVEWADWPQGAVRSDYITVAATPAAITDMTGSVARFEFFPGEPIRDQKLVRSGKGYLSAVLDKGMRGVSVSVAAESASGGFVVPNDHVDVVLTRASATAGQVSEIIVRNARVLAINARLGELGVTGAPADPANPRAEVFADHAIATLELNPTQAETTINATILGKLSLVLRPIADAAETEIVGLSPANQQIRMNSPFWSK